VANRWLGSYPPSGKNGFGAAGSAPRCSLYPWRSPAPCGGGPPSGSARGRFSRVILGVTPWLPSFAGLSGLTTALISLLISVHLLRAPRTHMPLPLPGLENGLVAVKIERAEEATGAENIIAARASNADRLFHRWNRVDDVGGSARHEHGHAPKHARARFYIPVPRENFKAQFDSLADAGTFARLQLHVVHVPPSWTRREVELQKYGWAHGCHVVPEAIDLWSSFVVSTQQMQNQCDARDTCLIVSDGDCDAGTFDDLDAAETQQDSETQQD
jgi:hypothetical protein